MCKENAFAVYVPNLFQFCTILHRTACPHIAYSLAYMADRGDRGDRGNRGDRGYMCVMRVMYVSMYVCKYVCML